MHVSRGMHDARERYRLAQLSKKKRFMEENIETNAREQCRTLHAFDEDEVNVHDEQSKSSSMTFVEFLHVLEFVPRTSPGAFSTPASLLRTSITSSSCQPSRKEIPNARALVSASNSPCRKASSPTRPTPKPTFPANEQVGHRPRKDTSNERRLWFLFLLAFDRSKSVHACRRTVDASETLFLVRSVHATPVLRSTHQIACPSFLPTSFGCIQRSSFVVPCDILRLLPSRERPSRSSNTRLSEPRRSRHVDSTSTPKISIGSRKMSISIATFGGGSGTFRSSTRDGAVEDLVQSAEGTRGQEGCGT